MKKSTILFMFATIFTAATSFSQKITVLEGDLSVLSGEKILNIEYDYSEMSVGKFEKEEDYVDKKVEEMNAKEKGKGDKWKQNWEGDRIGRFQPAFELLMNKFTANFGLYVGNEKESKYKMIVRTTFVEPGYYIYVSKKFASIDIVVDIVETANPENVVCKIVSKGNPGRTYGTDDYDTGLRISEAYELAGKKLGIYFEDYFKKKKK